MTPQPALQPLPRKVLPYTILAQVYDTMMNHVNYRHWACYINELTFKVNIKKDFKTLDIGCGTGRFLKELAKLGKMGDGCDQSAEMLKIARKRLPGIKLYHSTLPDLEKIPQDTYQLVTCLYDTMNYLLEPSTLTSALNIIYAKLASPGLLIFDLVSQSYCKRYFRNYQDEETIHKNLAYSRESYYNTQANVQFNRIRIYTPEGTYEEEHQQRIYNFYMIKELISQTTDFKLEHLYEGFTFKTARSSSNRAHFLLTKT